MKNQFRRIVFLPLRPRIFLPLLSLLRMVHVIPSRKINASSPLQKILIVNLTDFVGDTVMMLPLLDRLHAVFPNAEIDVAASSSMASFLCHIPYLHHVYSFTTRKINLPILGNYQRLFRMIGFVRTELNNSAYDLCVVPRWGSDPTMSVFLANMTSAGQIIGNDPRDEESTHELFPGVSQLLSCAARGGFGLPEAIRELRVLEACNITPPLNLAAEETSPIKALSLIVKNVSFADLKQRLEINDVAYAVLAPGASHPSRRWPPERFAEVAISLYNQFGIPSFIIGGLGDKAIGETIINIAGTSTRSLIGKTSLAETIAILSRATLLVTNDSGPAHLGAGAGTPTIVLSICPITSTREHANSPLRIRPVGPKVQFLQPENPLSGCGERCTAHDAHCILGLRTEYVLGHIHQMLS